MCCQNYDNLYKLDSIIKLYITVKMIDLTNQWSFSLHNYIIHDEILRCLINNRSHYQYTNDKSYIGNRQSYKIP